MKNVKLFHKVYGEGEPLIVLHGLFGMSDNWVTFAKQMSHHRMVILVDIRDHGRSPHTEEFNYEIIAEDVAYLMESNWIHHADIMGHSMGGKAAMKLAHLHPDMVNKLIIVDIGPGLNPDRHDHIFNALKAVDTNTPATRKEAEEIISAFVKDARIIRFLMKNLARDGKRGFRWKINLPLLQKNFQHILSQMDIEPLDIPTLFIKGEQSSYIDTKQLEIIEDLFTNFTLEEIKDAGHWVHADQPDVFFHTVLDFLN